MNTLLEVAANTEETAEDIALQRGYFDDIAAELVLRNMAVVMDRLTAYEYADLEDSTKAKVEAVAKVADTVAPPEQGELARYPDESYAEYNFRVYTQGPLHRLQRTVAMHDFDNLSTEETKDLRTAVYIAGRAFNAVVQETEYIEEVQKTERYFTGNTAAAAGRIAIKHG